MFATRSHVTRKHFAMALVALATFASPTLSPAQTATRVLPPGRVEIDVEDLHCKTCAKRVARKLYAVRGVKKVESSLKKDLVVVTLAKGQAPQPVLLWNAVDAAGVKPAVLRHTNQSFDADAMAPLLEASLPRIAK